MSENVQFKKYERIPHLADALDILDSPVQVYEKMDGGNAQVRTSGFRIFPGNRSHFISEKRDNAYWFGDFFKWAQRNRSFINLPEEFVLFGEWVDSNSNLNYPYRGRKKGRFFVLDLYDSANNRLLEYGETKNVLLDRGIEGVVFLRCLHEGRVDAKTLGNLCQKSDYRSGVAEGVVIKDYENQRMAKLWTKHVNGQPLDRLDVERAVRSLVEQDKKIDFDGIVAELRSDFPKATEGQIRGLVRKVFFKF